MKKFALIAASLAVLASPVFADRRAQDHRHRAGRSQVLDGRQGRDVLVQAEGPLGHQPEGRDRRRDHRSSRSRTTTVDALILSVGGFLGMGEHYVAVSPSSVNVRYDQKNDKWLASMNTTKDALKAAPEFKYPK